MKPAPIVLFCLLLTSLTLLVMLAVAWRCFGRPRAALFWSAMFGMSTIAWAINLGGVLFAHGWQLYFPWVEFFVGSGGVLLVAGFLARARRRQTWLLPLAIVGAGTMLLTIAGCVLANAVCVALSAAIVRVHPREPSSAERLVTAILALIAAFYAASGVMAAALPVEPQNLRLIVYRLVILLGVPPCSMGIGLSCIFLIASDLAEQMQRLAATDALTGVFNRRGLAQAADPMIAVCRRAGQPFAVIVADLDRFKTINDRFGHATGDYVLRRFADHAARSLRRGDLLARLGGEEFGILMPNTTVAQATEAVERLRAGLAAIEFDGIAPLTLTASFGIAVVEGEEDGLDQALARADLALYAAKQEGRDRVRHAPQLVARS
jgi:diguanylate cyclase (GGDEF)-like protein